jgi:hypothetical protein
MDICESFRALDLDRDEKKPGHILDVTFGFCLKYALKLKAVLAIEIGTGGRLDGGMLVGWI